MGQPTSSDQSSVISDQKSKSVHWLPITDHYKEVFVSEYIGYKGEPGELKHLSTRRKGHQRDSVSSGERTRTRPTLLVF